MGTTDGKPAAGAKSRRRRISSALAFGLFSGLLSLGFFYEGIDSGFSSLSGDQINYLTVCARLDHPDLLEEDLLVGNPESVQHYIPLFIRLVRLVSLPDHDYLRGLNVLLFATSLLYLWGWWVLFSTWGDRWVAAVLAFLARGILWPPGYELWGIAGLWTMLPRTLFLALLPWVLSLWLRHRGSRLGWPCAAVSSGLLVNVHPLSGACCVVALLGAELSWSLLESRRRVGRRVLAGGAAMLIGMAPYLWTYASKVRGMGEVDPRAFEEALRMRISPILTDPGVYLRLWLGPKWLLLVLGPWLAWLVWRKRLEAHRNAILSLGAFGVTCVAMSVVPFGVEAALAAWGHPAWFAFHLVRSGKYLLVPSFLLGGLLCVEAGRRVAAFGRHGRSAVIAVSSGVVLLTLVARHPVFDGVPVLGDDVCRQLWPYFVSPGDDGGGGSDGMDAMLAWIRRNTAEDATFVGPRWIRVGALRSVIHEFGGAAMLIEGDPARFVEVARREKRRREVERDDPARQGELFASWGAEYWATGAYHPGLDLVYSDAEWFVYRLDASR